MKPVSEVLATDGGHDEWIPLIQMSAREVFELMLGCQLTVSPAVEDANLNVTAMVGLAGQLSGVMSVRCDRDSATLMTSKMLGVPVDKVGPEVSDALGEIANMVAGNFKNKISGLAEGCMLSPPTIITGNDYNLHSIADAPAITVGMLFEALPIVISLQVHS